jgi:hypothetical protein
MSGVKGSFAVAVAFAVAALLLPAVAEATPPSLTGVGETITPGILTASWTLPEGMSAEYVEVATTPRSYADGSFVLSVLYDTLSAADTTWTATTVLPAGHYYVHVAAFDTAGFEEFSDPVPVTIGIPSPPTHPPVLDSVEQASGVVTANWTLPANEGADFIEISESQEQYASGGFFVDETMLFDFFSDPAKTTYTSTQPLPPGTYYVHVAGFDDTQCPSEPACFIDEYSNTLNVTIPPSSSGSGGGGSSGGSTSGQQPTSKPKPPAIVDKSTAFAKLNVTLTQDVDKLFVLASMAETGTLTAGGTVSVPSLSKVYRFKTASATAVPGASVKLKLKLAKKALKVVKKALKRHKKLKAKLTITASDRAGNKKTEKRTVSLKP